MRVRAFMAAHFVQALRDVHWMIEVGEHLPVENYDEQKLTGRISGLYNEMKEP
jgi:hypothetical protein